MIEPFHYESSQSSAATSTSATEICSTGPPNVASSKTPTFKSTTSRLTSSELTSSNPSSYGVYHHSDPVNSSVPGASMFHPQQSSVCHPQQSQFNFFPSGLPHSYAPFNSYLPALTNFPYLLPYSQQGFPPHQPFSLASSPFPPPHYQEGFSSDQPFTLVFLGPRMKKC